jgi:signal transduction histidine kinase/CheY-like chemotaxis protein
MSLPDALAPFADWPTPVLLCAPDGRVITANRAGQGRAPAPGDRLAPLVDGKVLRFAVAESEEARAKTMLFATLSHEIRTPLNGILGMAGLLSMTPLADAQRSYLTAIRQSGDHLLSLLNDILDFAKLEAAALELEELVFDPAATLQSVAELMSPRAREKGLDIEVIAAPDTPAKLRGDDGRLRQIVTNLVSNAVKFTEAGGVIVRAAPAGSAPDGRLLLRVSVSDTGIGIPADKFERVFDEFAQADSSHTRRYGGTGLGLAIVRKLAVAMGGSVGLESQDGAGATFWADIPFAVEADPAPAADELGGAILALATASAIVAEAAGALAARLGARLRPITSPHEAEGAALILLDHGFAPVEDFLKAGPPLVALMPQEDREAITAVMGAGVAAYLVKPLRAGPALERLALVARGAIGQSEDERARARPDAGVRVLLAEDNPINALLARALLERGGCEVVTVGTGAEAVRALVEAPYDLVFLDLHMPELDGFGAAAAIRALEGARARTPLIALTANAMEEDRRACLEAGMDDFIPKPLEAERLHQLLARWTRGPERGTVAA